MCEAHQLARNPEVFSQHRKTHFALADIYPSRRQYRKPIFVRLSPLTWKAIFILLRRSRLTALDEPVRLITEFRHEA